MSQLPGSEKNGLGSLYPRRPGLRAHVTGQPPPSRRVGGPATASPRIAPGPGGVVAIRIGPTCSPCIASSPGTASRQPTAGVQSSRAAFAVRTSSPYDSLGWSGAAGCLPRGCFHRSSCLTRITHRAGSPRRGGVGRSLHVGASLRHPLAPERKNKTYLCWVTLGVEECQACLIGPSPCQTARK